MLFLVAALGFGASAARRLWAEPPGGLFLCASFGLGAGLLSVLFFVLMSTNGFTRTNTLIIIAAGVALFAANIKIIKISVVGIVAGAFGQGASRLTKTCAAVITVFVLAAATTALAPPVDVDALSYHLALPKLYAAAGGFVSTPSIVYSNFPLGVEILFAFPLLLKSAVGASLVSFSFGVFAMLGIASLGNRLSGGAEKAGPLGALLFVGTPLVLWEMRSSYIDLAMCFYIFISLALLVSQMERKSMAGVAAAGLLAGFAVAAKLTAGPVAAVLLATVPLVYQDRFGKRLAAAAIFFVCCAAPVIPWFIRTYIETGNPFFPFAYNILGGRNWNPAVNAEFLKWHLGYGLGRGLKESVELPFNLAFRAAGNFGWRIARPDRELGWFFLFFIPILFMPGGALRKRGVMAFFVVLSLATWFFGTQQLRFLLVFWPALCLLYAGGLMNAAGKWRIAPVAAGAVIIISLGMNAYAQSRSLIPAVRAIAGGEAVKEEYIENNNQAQKAFAALDALSGGGSGGKAGLLLETRSFYSTTPSVWLNPTQQGILDYGKIGGPETLFEELRKLDVEYLLVQRSAFMSIYEEVDGERKGNREYSRYFLNFFRLYQELLNSRKAKLVYATGNYVIFRLSENGGE
ncbi:MAG: hypothetical protein WCX65_16665 [bacterium]